MSTTDGKPPDPAPPPAGLPTSPELASAFDTDLIARVANELFAETGATAPPPQIQEGVQGGGWDEMDPGVLQRIASEPYIGAAESLAGMFGPRPESPEDPRDVQSGAPALPRSTDAAFYYFLPRSETPPSAALEGHEVFDAAALRRDFPALNQRVHGKPLVWLDNAATTQKPRAVIETLRRFYERDNSNVHRGAHALAARATNAYEGAREKAQRFLGASSSREIVFVRGTTEAINLVAQAWGRQNVGPGDEIILTTLEHHSNIVPWQLLAREKGAVIRVVPITDRGELILEEYQRLLGPRTKLVAMSQVSNALGTVLPVAEMVAMAHRHGARTVVDGAQAVSHFRVNVQALDCDFYALSGHKIFGPTGVGVLYGKETLLEDMPPWQGGGSMIKDVTFERTTYNDVPYKFEAGTPIIAAAVGLGAALDYVNRVGLDNIARHEQALLAYGTEALSAIRGVRLIGTAPEKASVLSFVVAGVPTEELGRLLDREGIAVRSGHHCAQPALRHFGLSATVRPSLALYNTHDDIDALVRAVRKAQGGRG